MSRNDNDSASWRGAVPGERLSALIRAQRGHLSQHQRAVGGEIVALRLRRGPSQGRTRVVAFALAAACGLAAAISGWEQSRSRPLSYSVQGGHVDREGGVATDRAAPAVLRFSDGSEVTIAKNTKARLRAIDPHGAFIALSDGSAHVDIVHGAGARWIFEAGPFSIKVTGTEFTVAWTAADEGLDVQMDRGSVEVSGPLSDAPIALRSGQHLIVHVKSRETLIQENSTTSTNSAARPAQNAPTDSADPATVEAPTDASDPSIVDAGAAARASLREAVAADQWPTQVGGGRFETVLTQAGKLGIENCLAVARQEDLAALADAARYARRYDLARRALLTLRQRFPGSREAHDASFLLGRIQESNGAARAALELYTQYLAQQTSVTYASEALGRSMTLTRQLFGDDRARPLAAEYLRHFPRGTYATAAEALSGLH